MPIPERAFAVLLHGDHVGLLRQRGAYSRFTLNQSYLYDPDRFVLGLIFEQDLPAKHSDRLRLPPWFANLLPEGELKKWIAIEQGVPLVREVELLARIGHDLPGAVQLMPAESEPDDIAWHDPTDRRRANRPSTGIRFSLAGVTMKFSMVDHGARLTLPALDETGDSIVKLPDATHTFVPHNEYAMMSLAADAGIEVPTITLRHRDELPPLPDLLWPNKEEWVYVIRRFDRDDERRPIHIEDLAQVRDVYPEQKYESNYETIASLVYRRHDEGALREFTRRMVFNTLIGNGDAHLKNWSLIYHDRRRPSLSPAYDLVSTVPYGYGDGLNMPFLGAIRFGDINLATFTELERKLKVSTGLADVAADVVTRVAVNWPHREESLAAHPTLLADIGNHIRTQASRLLAGRIPG